MLALAAAVALGAVLPGTQVRAEGPTFRDFPFVVFCEYNGVHHAYYFSRLGTDGRAIYMTPDRLAGSITVQGQAERISGDEGGNCVGKTTEELRASGQAFDLPR
jgi:hypothetical protein